MPFYWLIRLCQEFLFDCGGFICSGRRVWSFSQSDRFLAYLAQVGPVATVYLIWGVCQNQTMTVRLLGVSALRKIHDIFWLMPLCVWDSMVSINLAFVVTDILKLNNGVNIDGVTSVAHKGP